MTNQPPHSQATPAGIHLPAPTLWPAALALGSSLILWGMISSLILTAFGTALFVTSLWGWIGDIRNERKQHGPDHRS